MGVIGFEEDVDLRGWEPTGRVDDLILLPSISSIKRQTEQVYMTRERKIGKREKKEEKKKRKRKSIDDMSRGHL